MQRNSSDLLSVLQEVGGCSWISDLYKCPVHAGSGSVVTGRSHFLGRHIGSSKIERKIQCPTEVTQVGPSRFARQSLKQTSNVHPNFLPIKLLISQSRGHSLGQETQQTAFRNALAPQAKVALKPSAVAAVAYVRRTPPAHRGGDSAHT